MDQQREKPLCCAEFAESHGCCSPPSSFDNDSRRQHGISPGVARRQARGYRAQQSRRRRQRQGRRLLGRRVGQRANRAHARNQLRHARKAGRDPGGHVVPQDSHSSGKRLLVLLFMVLLVCCRSYFCIGHDCRRRHHEHPSLLPDFISTMFTTSAGVCIFAGCIATATHRLVPFASDVTPTGKWRAERIFAGGMARRKGFRIDDGLRHGSGSRNIPGNAMCTPSVADGTSLRSLNDVSFLGQEGSVRCEGSWTHSKRVQQRKEARPKNPNLEIHNVLGKASINNISKKNVDGVL